MSETQLREAYTLMKQGDKTGAARLVQDVLRQDRSNLNAWWLMSHLLEDEAKIVNALENVLTVNPEHLGARKRLAELRPEYSHLYASANVEKAKSKTDQAATQYWNKLYNSPAKKKAANNLTGFSLVIGLLCAGGLILFTIMVIVSISASGDIDTDRNVASLDEDRYSIIARMENSPEGVAQAYNEAYYREDIPTLYAISCETNHPELDELVEEFDNSHPERVTVDFSETQFMLDKDYSDDQYAYVRVEGFTTVKDGGVTLRTDWGALAAAQGYEYFGLNLENIEGSWKVCD